MKTEYGECRINSNGYYQVTSRKEGNKGAYLHRLLFEKFYGEIPDGYIVHHKNENRADNCILNLQLMKKGQHISHHKTGTEYTDEVKLNIAKHNRTGYFRVHKKIRPDCVQGFTYEYQYYEGNKRKCISSVDISKLKEVVLSKGLLWKEIDTGCDN